METQILVKASPLSVPTIAPDEMQQINKTLDGIKLRGARYSAAARANIGH